MTKFCSIRLLIAQTGLLVKFSQIVNKSATADAHFKQVLLLQCIPITTLLLALNVTHVDYFSLNIEGNELDVLRTID